MYKEREERNYNYCIYCKDEILGYEVCVVDNGKYYHFECYCLEHPREDDELEFD